MEVYLTLDGVMSAAGASAAERLAALRRHPSTERLPGALVFARALALAEAGEWDEAERLLATQYVPREEGGTSARAVFVQVRVLRAHQASESGDCDGMRRVIASLDREVAGVPFTKGGLSDLTKAPAVQWQLTRIASRCRDATSDERLERLAEWPGENANSMRVALAADAARLAGRPLTPEQRARVEREIANLADLLDSGEAGSPGVARWTQGLLLRALGREAEARTAWRRVFYVPDRNLSHALARTALREPMTEAR